MLQYFLYKINLWNSRINYITRRAGVKLLGYFGWELESSNKAFLVLQLKYTRPGLPTFSQEVLHKWKSDIKKYHRIPCPNQVVLPHSFIQLMLIMHLILFQLFILVA